MECKVDYCTAIVTKREYCEPHYRRLLKYGDPTAGRMFKGIRGNQPCTIENCTNLINSDGLCELHYHRRSRYGDPLGGGPVLQKEYRVCDCGNPLCGRKKVCDECKKIRLQIYYQENKEKIISRTNHWRILRLYGEAGLKVEARRQAGDPCDACGRRVESMTIDHCHESGRVRGLLCKPCNFALGIVEDDPARLRALADYLEAC